MNSPQPPMDESGQCSLSLQSREHGVGVSTKLATRLLSGPLSPLISGVVLLQLITTLTRDKYSNINLILFTFQSHLDGINGTEVD